MKEANKYQVSTQARRTPSGGDRVSPESPLVGITDTSLECFICLGRKPIVGLYSCRSGSLPSGLVLEHLSNALRVPCTGSGPAAAQLLQPVYQTPAEGMQGACTPCVSCLRVSPCPGPLLLGQFQLPWHCTPGKQKQHLGWGGHSLPHATSTCSVNTPLLSSGWVLTTPSSGL